MNALEVFDVENISQEKVLELALLIPKLYENEYASFGATDDIVSQMLGISRDEFEQLCVTFKEINRAAKIGQTISRAKTINFVMQESLNGNKISGQLITYMLREVFDVKKSQNVNQNDDRMALVKALAEHRSDIELQQQEIRSQYKNITYVDVLNS